MMESSLRFRIIFLLLFAVPITAQHVALEQFDSNTNQLFSQLAQYRNLSKVTDEFTNTQNALAALFNALTPAIKSFANYTGVFTGNCSVFFEDTIESANCDFAPGNPLNVTLTGENTESKRLPEAYWHQITLTNVLLASIFADWRRGKLQEFESDLYFKLGTCSQTLSSTMLLTRSRSESSTLNQTRSCSDSSSDTLSGTDSSNKTPTFYMSPSDSTTGNKSLTNSAESSLSSTDSLATSTTKSLTHSQGLSQSGSLTSPETSSKTLSRLSGLLAAWNQTGGTYADATTQTSRYSSTATTVTDTLTGLQWELVPSAFTMTWAQAVEYCVNEATGGFHDWRLPNNAELESLVDYTINYVGTTPGINAVFSGTPTNYFYSSTPLVGSPTQQPWWMSFGQTACYSGLLYSLQYSPSCTPAVAGQGYARCVRSPYRPLPAVRYTTTSDTVTDMITGLIWQRVSTGSTMTQANAITHCSGLSLPSFSSGWRLPKVRELATLVDYSVPDNRLMMDATVFASEPANYFWSSTPLAGYPIVAWSVNFYSGDVNNNAVTDSYLSVRCVR